VGVNLVWHTWTEESSDYNLAVSKRMSEGLIVELIQQGIDKNRIAAIGFGEARPIFTEDELDKITDFKKRSEMDRMNERVEVIIVSAPNKMHKKWR
jgi:outer membrane protein OmpA-like peptidoglycan-associated protein